MILGGWIIAKIETHGLDCSPGRTIFKENIIVSVMTTSGIIITICASLQFPNHS
jgi:hypothetical protein